MEKMMLNYVKKDFEYGDRIRFINLGGDELENKEGLIIGVANIDVINAYIVFLDEPLEYPEPTTEIEKLYTPLRQVRAVVITEVCLEKVK
jgi:hypothetical protein